ncbi:MAG: hypothetical protein ACMXYE_03100 [Candidatus Woesearchaeota archaeon]
MRAQSSIEMLVLFSAMIIIVLALLTSSDFVMRSVDSTSKQSIARQSLDDLGMAATRVYMQGFGATESLAIRLPDSIESAELINDTIRFSLSTTRQDAVQILERQLAFNLTGELPSSAGMHVLIVRSEGKTVDFGS